MKEILSQSLNIQCHLRRFRKIQTPKIFTDTTLPFGCLYSRELYFGGILRYVPGISNFDPPRPTTSRTSGWNSSWIIEVKNSEAKSGCELPRCQVTGGDCRSSESSDFEPDVNRSVQGVQPLILRVSGLVD